MLGDYCDASDECLSEKCDSKEHRCVSFDAQGGDKGSKIYEERIHEEHEIEKERRRNQIKNVVIIACVIAFICLVAIFLKCIQK